MTPAIMMRWKFPRKSRFSRGARAQRNASQAGADNGALVPIFSWLAYSRSDGIISPSRARETR